MRKLLICLLYFGCSVYGIRLKIELSCIKFLSAFYLAFLQYSACNSSVRLWSCRYMASISLILNSFPVIRKVSVLWQYGHSLAY